MHLLLEADLAAGEGLTFRAGSHAMNRSLCFACFASILDSTQNRVIMCCPKAKRGKYAPAEDGRGVDLCQHGVQQPKVPRMQIQLSSQHRAVRLKQHTIFQYFPRQDSSNVLEYYTLYIYTPKTCRLPSETPSAQEGSRGGWCFCIPQLPMHLPCHPPASISWRLPPSAAACNEKDTLKEQMASGKQSRTIYNLHWLPGYEAPPKVKADLGSSGKDMFTQV